MCYKIKFAYNTASNLNLNNLAFTVHSFKAIDQLLDFPSGSYAR